MHDDVQADAQAASRELREQLRRDAEEQVLGAIEYATGAVVRLAWYREPGRPRVLSIWVYYPDGRGGFRPDPKRGLRFYPHEVPALGRAIAKALRDVRREGRRR